MSERSSTIDDTRGDAVVIPVERSRRGVGGRLYHGETAIDFYGRRWWGIGASAVLLVVTIASLVVNGLNLGIDFEGGVAWEVPSANLTEEQARSVLVENGVDESQAKVQTLTSDSGTRLRLQVGDQPQDVVTKVRADLASRAGVATEEVTSVSVSSSWGRSITEKAVRALIIFILLVMIFISWRLTWQMAIASIVAMIHDVLISVGVYSLFGFEVTPATVVAFLTILGYSLYDTIVVFDKVNENTARFATMRVPYADVVNVSMNQVLMRSLNTTVAALLPVLSLLIIGSVIMGATTLREFAIALLVGLATGAYSSIFIAAPLLTMIKEREPKYRSLRATHATGAELERLVLGGTPGGGARREAKLASASVMPTSVTPAAALTHAPRPRKKRRR
jgi:preprotein translocase subunit SecF